MPKRESQQPIVFLVAPDAALQPAGNGLPSRANHFGWRVGVRPMTGLQKEAMAIDPDGRMWRMAGDEGRQLGGQELYPCPLEYFGAGTAFCLVTQLKKLAGRRGLKLDSARVAVDHRYYVDGSVLRETIRSSASAPALTVWLETGAAVEEVKRLVTAALASSPAEAYGRQALVNRFGLLLNGLPVTLPALEAAGRVPDIRRVPRDLRLLPAGRAGEVVSRLDTSPEDFCRESETLREVQIEQRGRILVHAEGWLTADLALEGLVQQCVPLVSGFHLRSVVPHVTQGASDAPPPLAFLLVGVATCFFTQLQRFAHTTKTPVKSVFMSQDSSFRRLSVGARGMVAEPVSTQVLLEGDISEDLARRAVTTAAAMCFVHALMREELPSTVAIWRNGVQVA